MAFDLIRGYRREIKRPALAARLFDNAANEYQRVTDGNLPSGVPLTLVAWIKTDDLTANQHIVSCGDSTVNADWQALTFNGFAGGDPIQASSRNGGIASASTTTSVLADVWVHAAAVFAAANDRRAFLNGGGKGTNAGVVAGPVIDRIAIGTQGDSVPAGYFSGSVFLPAVYDIALSDSEILKLAQGVLPWLVRPQSLIACWDAQGRNLVNNQFALTSFNTPGWSYGPHKIRNVWMLPFGFVSGGIAYNQAAAGVWSGAGNLIKQTQISPDGIWSGAGSLVRQTQVSPDGVWSGAGAMIKQTQKLPAGVLTSSGSLVKETQKSPAGVFTSSGSLIKQAQKELAGIFTSSGSLVRMTGKELAGILTSSGALVTLATHFIDPAGIASAEAFGAAIVMLMDQYIIPNGITTEEAFGLTRILGGERLMGLWEHILLRLRRE